MGATASVCSFSHWVSSEKYSHDIGVFSPLRGEPDVMLMRNTELSARMLSCSVGRMDSSIGFQNDGISEHYFQIRSALHRALEKCPEE